MTNGMRLQADGAAGGAPPAGVPTAADASAATAGPGRALLAVVAPVGGRTRRRASLAVIPRRATGIRAAPPTALPPSALSPPALPPSALPPSALPPSALPPPSMSRRRRAGLLGAAAVLLAAAVAVPLWLDDNRTAPTAQQVTPIGAGLPTAPGDPGTPTDTGAPTGDASAGPTEGTGPAYGTPSPTGPADGADTPPEADLPDAPGAVVTRPARRPQDVATQEPPDQGSSQPAPPAQDPPQDEPTFAPRGNPTGRNLALGQQVFASSFANRFRSPAQAVDGKLLSKWSTRATNEQWIAVDLGDTFRINRVRIAWELAFANTYRVDLSTDGRSWTPVWQTRNGLGGTVGVPMDDDAAARFVRVFGVRPAGPLGYAIRELDVR